MKRNGKIELMRFVFCVCILLFHIVAVDGLWGGKVEIGPFLFFYRGYFGVEYFFLVSGALLAKSVRSRLAKEEAGQLAPAPSIGDETLGFLWKKVQALLPYHVFFCLIMLVLLVVGFPENFPFNVMDRFLSLFFLDRTGVCTTALLGIEWYISAMLLVMALYYPLCKRHFRTFTHLIAPFAGVMILGYMQLSLGRLGGAALMNGITFHTNFRALGEIAIGIACYEVALALSKRTFTLPQRALISCLEAIGYVATVLFICSDLNTRYEIVVFSLLCVSVTLSFTQKGLLGESRLFQNNLCLFLGAISMPLYLSQNIGRWIGILWLSDIRPLYRLVGTFCFTMVLGTATYLVWTWIQKQPNKHKIVTRLAIVLVIAAVGVSFVGYQLAV